MTLIFSDKLQIQPGHDSGSSTKIVYVPKYNFTQVNGIYNLADNTYSSQSKTAYLQIPEIPLDLANSWEFRTKYRYNGGSEQAVIIGGSSMHLENGFRLWVSSNRFHIELLRNFADYITSPELATFSFNITYYIRAGFTGSNYYCYVSTKSFLGSEICNWSYASSEKIYINDTYLLMNREIDYSGALYSSGLMYMDSTKFIINNEDFWIAITDRGETNG